jgi:hypothetical protein
MIATSRFVFIHLHKSGGTFVIKCLLRFVSDAKEIHYHYPRRMTPPELAHLPVLGLVRNPWDYYVSWHAFQLQNVKLGRPTNPLYSVLSDDGRLGFEETIRNMVELGSRSEFLDKLVAALPKEYTNTRFNVPGPEMDRIRNTGRGFYTHLYRHLYEDAAGRSDDVRMGRMENLRKDIVAMFDAVGQPISDEMRAHILQEPPANTSKHDDYTQYYTPALRDLVAERDAELIDRYGYRFGREG